MQLPVMFHTRRIFFNILENEKSVFHPFEPYQDFWGRGRDRTLIINDFLNKKSVHRLMHH